jgi:hypothetical protein
MSDVQAATKTIVSYVTPYCKSPGQQDLTLISAKSLGIDSGDE